MVSHLQFHGWIIIARADAHRALEWSDRRLASARLHVERGRGQLGISHPDRDHSIRAAHESFRGCLWRLLRGRDHIKRQLRPVSVGAGGRDNLLLGSAGPRPLRRPRWDVVRHFNLRDRRFGFFAQRFSQQFDDQPRCKRQLHPHPDADQ